MKNFKWLKIIILIILGAIIGIAAFSFIMVKNLWFPSPLQIIEENKIGVEMKAYTYLPWLWNRERTAKIELFDRKNDGPKFEIKLKGNITNIQLIHSGEDFAVVSSRLHYKDASGYQDTIYILHRVPQKDGKESLDSLDIAGMITVVTPDESGYFTYNNDEGVLTKYDWEGKSLMSVNLPKDLEFPAEGPSFVDGANKLNIKFYDHDKDESVLFAWDLVGNTTSTKISDGF